MDILLKRLFEVLKQLLGFGRILTPLGHLYPWRKRITLVSLAPSCRVVHTGRTEPREARRLQTALSRIVVSVYPLGTHRCITRASRCENAFASTGNSPSRIRASSSRR